MKSLSFEIAAVLALVAAPLLVLSSCSTSTPDRRDVNWVGVGGSMGEPHFGDLRQISTESVGELGLAWSLDLDDEQSLEATPLAIDGVLYFTGSKATVYAVDAVSGKLRWKFDPESSTRRPNHLRYNLPVNRGVAYADGKVFVGTRDGRLIALSAIDGKPVWSVMTVTEESYLTITGAPRIAGDKVVIGNGGGDAGGRGYVTAYGVRDGRQAWRFYTAPGNPADGFEQPAMKLAASTWSGKWWEIGTGGTVWNAMVYDPDTRLLLLGTGNSGPYNPRLRNPKGGDNLFLVSIVAVNADTGQYVWHYQMNPNEAWDYNAAADMILATIKIDGVDRKVVMQAPKNGFFYVLDRTTGKLISAEKLGKVTWAERIDIKSGRPVEAANIRYENGPVTIWPGPLGMHNWQPMSFSPVTGLVYVPTINAGAKYGSIDALVSNPVPRSPKMPFAGATAIGLLKPEGEEGTGGVVAWDPVKNTAAWRVKYPRSWNGGTLATAGNLVFAGDGEGILHAYDARNGTELWKFDAKLGIIGAPITYAVNGRQYVSILVGWGGAVGLGTDLVSRGWKYNAQPRRLLTFVLNGKATLPPTPPRDLKVVVLDKPDLKIDYAQATQGALTFGVTCAVCHGLGTRSGGLAPDLRESGIALEFESFAGLLANGGMEPNGMPRFADLSPEEVRLLYTYIRAKAREEKGTGQPVPDILGFGGR